MDVDVQIYVSNFKRFFLENPTELAGLIGQANQDDFFNEVERVAFKNYEKGQDVELTQKQIIGIILKLNHIQPEDNEKVLEPIFQTSWGDIFLN